MASRTAFRSLRGQHWLPRPVKPLQGLQQRRLISAYGYEQSKALIFSDYGEPDSILSLHTHSISPAHSDLLTIRFLASPINPADYNQLQGVYPTKPTFTTSLGTSSPVAVGGNEGVAEIISVGEKVKNLKKGDWVIMQKPGFGTWRTHAQTTEDQLLKIEDKSGITPAQAGTVSVNPCTAYRMLQDFAQLKPGDWFVQNGANSSVGLATIQLAKAWGYKSINIVRNRDKGLNELKQRLKDLGADEVITDAELQSKDIQAMIHKMTQGAPIKLGMNCVGGKPATALAKLLGEGGHMVTYGAMSKQPVLLPAGMLIFKNIHFHGFWVSKWSERNPEAKKKMVNDILQLYREGKFKDGPIDEVKWDWETEGKSLVDAVTGTLKGFRTGKGIFIFGKT
jgi:trans-2-enoyl-CoA reductase